MAAGDILLLVEPGSSADADPCLEKVGATGPLIPVGVDGGVNKAKLPACLEAGARYIVSGRALFPTGRPGHTA
jgi:pentose-5-phosphate-3-epimerase